MEKRYVRAAERYERRTAGWTGIQRFIPRGEYRIQCYKITREQGSPYDCWAAMGAPEAMTSEEKEMVCHSADPEYRVWRETVGEEQILSVQEHLKVHEVACIEIICLNHYRELH